MSRPRAIYVVSLRSIFHFQPHFDCHYLDSVIKTDSLVFEYFLEYPQLFLDGNVDEESQ